MTCSVSFECNQLNIKSWLCLFGILGSCLDVLVEGL